MPEYKSRYFSDPVSLAQIRCHCGCGKNNLDSMLLKILDKIREGVGRPVNINSGCRCEKHDLEIYLGKLRQEIGSKLSGALGPGGANALRQEYKEAVKIEKTKKRTSSHIKGLAVDIRVETPRERYGILKEVFQFVAPPITRIFIADSFIHIDIDSDKDQMVTGLY